MASNEQLNNDLEQDLLELLKEEKIEPTKPVNKSNLPLPLQFLQVFNITTGKSKIKSKALYQLFKAWSSDKSFSRAIFNTTISSYLKNKNGIYYVNENDIKLSQRVFQSITQDTKKSQIPSRRLKEHIELYLKTYGLERGNTWIELETVHEHYWTWAYKTKKTKRVYFEEFKKVMKLYFEMKKNQHDKPIIGIKQWPNEKNKQDEANNNTLT